MKLVLAIAAVWVIFEIAYQSRDELRDRDARRRIRAYLAAERQA